MTPVESSNIAAVGYDPGTATLMIQFKDGGLYHYAGVSPDEHQAMMDADSIGKHFHANIKGRFEHKRMDDNQ